MHDDSLEEGLEEGLEESGSAGDFISGAASHPQGSASQIDLAGDLTRLHRVNAELVTGREDKSNLNGSPDDGEASMEARDASKCR